MTTITIDELKERTAEIFDQLAHGEIFALGGTATGTPIPPTRGEQATEERVWTSEESDAFWAEWDRIGAEISKTWPEGVSAGSRAASQVGRKGVET